MKTLKTMNTAFVVALIASVVSAPLMAFEFPSWKAEDAKNYAATTRVYSLVAGHPYAAGVAAVAATAGLVYAGYQYFNPEAEQAAQAPVDEVKAIEAAPAEEAPVVTATPSENKEEVKPVASKKHAKKAAKNGARKFAARKAKLAKTGKAAAPKAKAKAVKTGKAKVAKAAGCKSGRCGVRRSK